MRGPRPALRSSGFSPLRTQNRKAVAETPIPSVIRLVSSICAMIEITSSTSVWPPASMPKICLSCEAAISTPEAVMKPAITGCDRKLARKPSFSTPSSVRNSPERNASVIAASAISPGVERPSCPMAVAVISETTATGPTASAREVPKIA